MEVINMDQTTLVDTKLLADVEYEKIIDNLIAEMKHTRKMMADDQHEIEKLQAQTRATIKQMKTA